MRQKFVSFLFVFGGIGAYVLIAGSSGACSACGALTNALGLSAATPASAASEGAAKEAPAWKLPSVDGGQLASSDLEGDVVLLDFWATWCAPCRKMIPGLIELQNEYGDEGLQIVGISLDREGPGVVRSFRDDFGINYPLAMGNRKVVEAFGGIRGIPTSFLIDRDGNIVAKHVGYTSKGTLKDEIEPLLDVE